MADAHKIMYSIRARVVVNGELGNFEQVLSRELMDDPAAFKTVMRMFDEALAKKISAKLGTEASAADLHEVGVGEFYGSNFNAV